VAIAAFIVVSSLPQAQQPPTTQADNPDTPSGSDTVEVRGFLVLTGPDGVFTSRANTRADDPMCWGQSQYQDIALGTNVVVFDDRDRIVAEGALEQGRAPEHATPADKACFFPIVVTDIPAGSAFYQVEVARRGTVLVQTVPGENILYAYIALDDIPGALPKVADQRPHLPMPQ
jgi:hypothetical protein